MKRRRDNRQKRPTSEVPPRRTDHVRGGNAQPNTPDRLWLLIAAVAILVVIAWTYSLPFGALFKRWWTEPDYAYCLLVPGFSLYLLWFRRELLRDVDWHGSWLGLILVAMAGVLQWISAYFHFSLIAPLSIIPCLAGVVLFMSGWNGLKWSWPAIAFLFFTVPLPGLIANQLSHQLQRMGTIAGTYVIQTVGVPAAARGNIIVTPNTHLGVAEACSGLRMMMLFFAVCTFVALVMKGNGIQKLVIVLSAVPISIFANVVRIVVTAILFEYAGAEVAHKTYHDLAGWFMMPLAVVILWSEIELMHRIILSGPEGPLASVPRADLSKA